MRRWRPPDPTFTKDWKEWARAIYLNFLQGDEEEICSCAGTGTLTLDSLATKTTVTNLNLDEASIIIISPLSSAAMGVAYWIERFDGSFAVHHAAGIAGAVFGYVFFN